MNDHKDEQRLLETYAHHTFEDRKDNLERIKARLAMESPSGKYAQKLFRRSRVCYGLSCLMLFLGVGIYSAYYWVIGIEHGQRHIAAAVRPDILRNLQSGRTLSIVYAFLTVTFLLAALLFGLALFFRKKAKNLKAVQQNGNIS